MIERLHEYENVYLHATSENKPRLSIFRRDIERILREENLVKGFCGVSHTCDWEQYRSDPTSDYQIYTVHFIDEGSANRFRQRIATASSFPYRIVHPEKPVGILRYELRKRLT